jgi:ABC-2 type transport system ATP-binding protein
VRDLIVGLKHSSRSIVLCTHDLDEAERLADTVAILRRGRIVACDTPAALRASASSETLVVVSLSMPCPAAVAIAQRVAGIWDLGQAGPSLTYRTNDPHRTNPEVIVSLVAAGARIVSVTCSTPTLEDVYAQALGANSPVPDDNRAVPLGLPDAHGA